MRCKVLLTAGAESDLSLRLSLSMIAWRRRVLDKLLMRAWPLGDSYL